MTAWSFSTRNYSQTLRPGNVMKLTWSSGPGSAAKMRFAKADRPRVKLECLRLLISLRLNRAKMQLIAGFVDAYLRFGEEEHRKFLDAVTAVDPPEQEQLMAVQYSFREFGIQEGES